MARASRWTEEERAKLWTLVKKGIPEQEIRQQLSTTGTGGEARAMNAVEFAQQLKQAMVEAGEIKQAPKAQAAPAKSQYVVTKTGRLTVSDFSELTGAKAGDKFILESPRGRSKSWRLTKV